jgi:hypothetical protein
MRPLGCRSPPVAKAGAVVGSAPGPGRRLGGQPVRPLFSLLAVIFRAGTADVFWLIGEGRGGWLECAYKVSITLIGVGYGGDPRAHDLCGALVRYGADVDRSGRGPLGRRFANGFSGGEPRLGTFRGTQGGNPASRGCEIITSSAGRAR